MDEDYTAFLRAACRRFPTFMLVWRSDLSRAECLGHLRKELRPFQIRHTRTTRWPGSITYGRNADVIFYRLEERVLALLERPRSLFAWRQPEFPEDLAFYAADRTLAFASVAHERDAWILDLEFGHLLPPSLGAVDEVIEDKEYTDYFNHTA